MPSNPLHCPHCARPATIGANTPLPLRVTYGYRHACVGNALVMATGYLSAAEAWEAWQAWCTGQAQQEEDARV